MSHPDTRYRSEETILHSSSFTLLPSPFIIQPSSFTLHPLLFILQSYRRSRNLKSKKPFLFFVDFKCLGIVYHYWGHQFIVRHNGKQDDFLILLGCCKSKIKIFDLTGKDGTPPPLFLKTLPYALYIRMNVCALYTKKEKEKGNMCFIASYFL